MENHSTPLHKLQEHIVGLAPVVHWLGQHPELDELTPVFHGLDSIGLCALDAEDFAVAVRALKDGAPLGTITREDDDSFTRFTRDFGAVSVYAYTFRSAVCEKVVVGTEKVVETAVRCVHCGEPIGENAGYGWLHVTADGGQYRCCGTTMDEDGNEVGGQPATPPSFAAQTVERDVVEWKCRPVLAGADALTDKAANDLDLEDWAVRS